MPAFLQAHSGRGGGEFCRARDVEDQAATTVDDPFHPVLTEVRARCVARAGVLPALPNPGTGGR